MSDNRLLSLLVVKEFDQGVAVAFILEAFLLVFFPNLFCSSIPPRLNVAPVLGPLQIVLWIIASWRVAKLVQLHQFTIQNYEERVTESVASTIKEQLLFSLEENHIPLPREKTALDVIDACPKRSFISFANLFFFIGLRSK